MSTESNPDNLTLDDFSENEHAAVAGMASDIITHFKGEKRAVAKFNSKNRSAWNRMNRPERLDSCERGAKFILGFLSIREDTDDTEDTSVSVA
jgi:hypothetical protein